MFIVPECLIGVSNNIKTNISTPFKLRKITKLKNKASISLWNKKETFSSEEGSKKDKLEFSSESSIDDKHSINCDQIEEKVKDSSFSKGAKSDASSNQEKFVKNPKFNSQESSSTQSSLNSEKDLIGYIQNVLCSFNKISNLKQNNTDCYEYKILKLSEHLKSHFELLKSTQSTITKIQNQKEAELNSVSRVFDKIRQEIDSKERLIKIQLTTIANNWEGLLIDDQKYLSEKWLSLCKILDNSPVLLTNLEKDSW